MHSREPRGFVLGYGEYSCQTLTSKFSTKSGSFCARPGEVKKESGVSTRSFPARGTHKKRRERRHALCRALASLGSRRGGRALLAAIGRKTPPLLLLSPLQSRTDRRSWLLPILSPRRRSFPHPRRYRQQLVVPPSQPHLAPSPSSPRHRSWQLSDP